MPLMSRAKDEVWWSCCKWIHDIKRHFLEFIMHEYKGYHRRTKVCRIFLLSLHFSFFIIITWFTNKWYILKMKFLCRERNSKLYPYIVFIFQQIFQLCFLFLWIEIFLTRCKIILQLASSLLMRILSLQVVLNWAKRSTVSLNLEGNSFKICPHFSLLRAECNGEIFWIKYYTNT